MNFLFNFLELCVLVEFLSQSLNAVRNSTIGKLHVNSDIVHGVLDFLGLLLFFSI